MHARKRPPELNGPILGILRSGQRAVLALALELALRRPPIVLCRPWPPAVFAPDFKSSAGDMFVSNGSVGGRHRKRSFVRYTDLTKHRASQRQGPSGTNRC